jgi:hypothetical protein
MCSVIAQWSESRRTHNHTLMSHLRFPNLEGQVSVFISPRNRETLLQPQALGSLYVVFYDSKGYGEGILNFPQPGGSERPNCPSKFEVTLRLTVRQSVCLGIEHPCGTCEMIKDGSAICSVITQWSESRRTREHTLLSHLRLPQPGGPGPRIYIPQEHDGPAMPPRALGSLYDVSYDSQVYGAGILTLPQPGKPGSRKYKYPSGTE